MPDAFIEAKKLYKTGRYRQALLMLSKMDYGPDDVDVKYYTGLCFAKLSEWEEAVYFLETVVNSHKDTLRIYQSRMILSYIYTISERIKLAEYELNKLIEEGYESPQAYCSYSYIYYKTGNIDKSIDFLNKALELDSENATALNSLGYILAENGNDIDSAMKYCKRALKKSPDNPAYLDSFGWANFKRKQVDEARYFLKRAYELAPDNKLIAKHLRTVINEIENKKMM